MMELNALHHQDMYKFDDKILVNTPDELAEVSFV